MFVNAENVRRPRTSTRRRFGSHLDFLHHLHETWKSQRPQKIPLSYTCVEPTCIWKFPCGFHTSNSAHCGSGSCCTQEVTRNRIPGWRRHVTAVTPELQHTSLLMCEGSITSCSFSYKCKTWTDSWLGKGNICHLDMGIKLVPDPSIHWTCIPQSLSEYLLSVLVCVWGFCVFVFLCIAKLWCQSHAIAHLHMQFYSLPLCSVNQLVVDAENFSFPHRNSIT